MLREDAGYSRSLVHSIAAWPLQIPQFKVPIFSRQGVKAGVHNCLPLNAAGRPIFSPLVRAPRAYLVHTYVAHSSTLNALHANVAISVYWRPETINAGYHDFMVPLLVFVFMPTGL